jgi:hypothetical protein
MCGGDSQLCSGSASRASRAPRSLCTGLSRLLCRGRLGARWGKERYVGRVDAEYECGEGAAPSIAPAPSRRRAGWVIPVPRSFAIRKRLFAALALEFLLKMVMRERLG